MYRDVEGPTQPIAVLNEICHQIPTHLILGRVSDLMCVNLFLFSFRLLYIYSTTLFFFFLPRPAYVHEALVDPNSGRRYASIEYVSGIGHLVRTILFLHLYTFF